MNLAYRSAHFYKCFFFYGYWGVRWCKCERRKKRTFFPPPFFQKQEKRNIFFFSTVFPFSKTAKKNKFSTFFPFSKTAEFFLNFFFHSFHVVCPSPARWRTLPINSLPVLLLGTGHCMPLYAGALIRSPMSGRKFVFKGVHICSLSKFENTPKALISGQKSTLFLKTADLFQ